MVVSFVQLFLGQIVVAICRVGCFWVFKKNRIFSALSWPTFQKNRISLVCLKQFHNTSVTQEFTIMSQRSSLRQILQAVHHNEQGSVSLETILIVGAVALPVLIFTIKFGWPKVRTFFYEGLSNLEGQSRQITEGQ